MGQPTVSVLLPNLNNRGFLDERIRTILDQTFSDWELVIVDNFSDDGAWEFFQTLPVRDARIRIQQAPREGLYANWNNCVQKARGRYVYIATSDDTMPPDCLEKLVAGIEAHPDCDLAHCRVKLIDQKGKDAFDWWSSGSVFSASAGALLEQEHVRRAPFDGLLHLSGYTVYTSITQLLIRRSLFDRVGLFENRWGSIGDFNWCMRAALVSNTVHIPDTWGGWRVYPGQATSAAGVGSADHTAKMEQMIDDAIDRSLAQLRPEVHRRLNGRWRRESRQLRELNREARLRPKFRERWTYLLSQSFAKPLAVRDYVTSRFGSQSTWPLWMPDIVSGWLRTIAPGPSLEAVSKPVTQTKNDRRALIEHR